MVSAHTTSITLASGDALCIADVQNDFLPGGALGIAGGDAIVPVLMRYLQRFDARGLPIYTTRDWHPPNHCSFHARGGIWPQHCVAGSPGAMPPATFQVPASAVIVYKATDPDKEAYSAFEGTGLHQALQAKRVSRLFVGGLATDYCVLNTVRDARRLGYAVVLLLDGICAVNAKTGDGEKAIVEMIELGAVPIRFDQLAP